MTKEQYMEISKDDPDVIELSNQDIIDWLDTAIESKKKMCENLYSLHWGELDEEAGEYENNIESIICRDEDKQLQIYSGIGKLAEAVGATLQYEKNGTQDYSHEFYFQYKGVKVFQCEREKRVTSKRV